METKKRILPVAALSGLVALALLVAAPANGAANRAVQGRGTTTQFLCESGVLTTATIQFQASKNKGNIFGSFNIFGTGVGKFGSLNSGTINTSSYSLTGSVNAFLCAGTSSTLPGQATISGPCGTAVTIHYTDTLGERGDFIGNVVCT